MTNNKIYDIICGYVGKLGDVLSVLYLNFELIIESEGYGTSTDPYKLIVN